MSKLTLKVKKVQMKHPKTKQPGFVARVLTNGTESFDDICEIAGMNTTYAQEEIVACAGLMLKAAARQLKNGKIIDLGPLGKLVLNMMLPSFAKTCSAISIRTPTSVSCS